jgi:two-component system response regulator AtoC
MLPPLRERREEIPVLSEYFLKKYSVQYNKPLTCLSAETMRLFMDYEWPGNVRELENLIKRAVVLGSEGAIRKEIQHGIAMAAHQSSIQFVSRTNGHAAAPPAPPSAPAPLTPAEFAAAEAAEGNYSLKDISREAARQAERELILKMLQHTRWNRKETAEILGISYKALLYKIKENGLDKAS